MLLTYLNQCNAEQQTSKTDAESVIYVGRMQIPTIQCSLGQGYPLF